MPVIRPATRADLTPLLAMIHALALHHGDVSGLGEANLVRDLFGATRWVDALVADDAARGLLGYVALLPLAQLQFGLRGMDLHHLFVQVDVRGTGLGRALAEATMDHASAQGCTYLTVGTHPDNQAAQAFYRHLGFDARPPSGPRFAKVLRQPLVNEN